MAAKTYSGSIDVGSDFEGNESAFGGLEQF